MNYLLGAIESGSPNAIAFLDIVLVSCKESFNDKSKATPASILGSYSCHAPHLFIV